MLWACSNNDARNLGFRGQSQNQSLDSAISSQSDEKYSIEEEQKVYGNVNFGISRNQYLRLIPKEVNKIGDFEFKLIPSFNHRGELYRLSIRGVEKQVEGNHDSKGYLIKLAEQKYGVADTSYRSRFDVVQKKNEKVLKSFPREVESYVWNIHNKQIIVSSEVLNKQDDFEIIMGKTNMFVYPIMTITHKKLNEDFNRVELEKENKVLEKEANKF
ncbi:hypothetical protein SAMN05660226_01988 [Parapedobacter luteus]|uniref:Uncharacterized protein n=2 Tax=Parapedobacter luteus TaxID=623280 RepID=A0A1T5C9Q2_9SPHI|nr:hypothetical protein SAMN05660226_01988 [Parapedobacter luteus]